MKPRILLDENVSLVLATRLRTLGVEGFLASTPPQVFYGKLVLLTRTGHRIR